MNRERRERREQEQAEGIRTGVRSSFRVFRVVRGTSCGICSLLLTRFSQFGEWFAVAAVRECVPTDSLPPH